METSIESKKTIFVRDALNEALDECLAEDEKVFLLGEEIAEYQGAYKVTRGLLEKYGSKRVVDTPITEYGFAGLAVGAAFNGLHPVVEFMSFNFSMQAIDHIINSSAKTRYMSGGQITCPIVFRGPNGSAARVGAQHSQCYASWYAHCPGLHVVAPYDAKSCKGLLKAAIKTQNPVVFLEHELMYGAKFDVTDDFNEPMSLTSAIVAKPGKNATLVSFSWMMSKAHEASKMAQEKNGLDVEVIDLVSLRPLDIGTVLASVKKTGRLIIAEEGWGFAGIGAEVASQVCENAFDSLDQAPIRVCAEDVPLAYAKNLERESLPSTEKIYDAILKACYLA